jgi:hypothetical protein
MYFWPTHIYPVLPQSIWALYEYNWTNVSETCRWGWKDIRIFAALGFPSLTLLIRLCSSTIFFLPTAKILYTPSPDNPEGRGGEVLADGKHFPKSAAEVESPLVVHMCAEFIIKCGAL